MKKDKNLLENLGVKQLQQASKTRFFTLPGNHGQNASILTLTQKFRKMSK